MKPAQRRAIIFTPLAASTSMTSRVTLSLTKTHTTSTSSPTVSTVSGLSRYSRNLGVNPAAIRVSPRWSRSYFLVSNTVMLVMA